MTCNFPRFAVETAEDLYELTSGNFVGSRSYQHCRDLDLMGSVCLDRYALGCVVKSCPAGGEVGIFIVVVIQTGVPPETAFAFSVLGFVELGSGVDSGDGGNDFSIGQHDADILFCSIAGTAGFGIPGIHSAEKPDGVVSGRNLLKVEGSALTSRVDYEAVLYAVFMGWNDFGSIERNCIFCGYGRERT